jgi:hypothetical protein
VGRKCKNTLYYLRIIGVADQDNMAWWHTWNVNIVEQLQILTASKLSQCIRCIWSTYP